MLWTRGKDLVMVMDKYSVGTLNTTNVKTHRLALRLYYRDNNKSWNPNLRVCHRCPGGDNKLCCNPDHLYLGTAGQNARDNFRKA